MDEVYALPTSPCMKLASLAGGTLAVDPAADEGGGGAHAAPGVKPGERDSLM